MQLRSGCDGSRKNKTGRRDLKSQKPARKVGEKRTAWKKSKKAGWSSLDRITSRIDPSENRSGWGASWFWSMPVLVAQVKKKACSTKTFLDEKTWDMVCPECRLCKRICGMSFDREKKKKKKTENAKNEGKISRRRYQNWLPCEIRIVLWVEKGARWYCFAWNFENSLLNQGKIASWRSFVKWRSNFENSFLVPTS